MRKALRKMMALALALVMVLAMSSISAFAADGDLTVDEKVTVSGFEAGDTVTAYQFITWVDGEGWKLADGITGITVAQIADGLTLAELATLAGQTDKMTAVSGTTSGTTWELTCGTVATAGSYLILVTDNNASHIYNPAVVSADFDGTNTAAVDLTAEAAMIKKQYVTTVKTADNATQAQMIMYSKLFKINFTKMDPYEFKTFTDILQRYSDLCKPVKGTGRGKKKK